jgi:hypothetical protein
MVNLTLFYTKDDTLFNNPVFHINITNSHSSVVESLSSYRKIFLGKYCTGLADPELQYYGRAPTPTSRFNTHQDCNKKDTDQCCGSGTFLRADPDPDPWLQNWHLISVFRASSGYATLTETIYTYKDYGYDYTVQYTFYII